MKGGVHLAVVRERPPSLGVPLRSPRVQPPQIERSALRGSGVRFLAFVDARYRVSPIDGGIDRIEEVVPYGTDHALLCSLQHRGAAYARKETRPPSCNLFVVPFV